jgi:hypothetical protein
MATTFSPNDRRRIVQALGLSRDQRLPYSRLDAIMQVTEQTEAEGAVGLVDDILAILSALEDADNARYGDTGEALGPIVPGNIPEGVERLDIDREMLITFQPGRSPADDTARTRAANVARLRQLLDPNNQLGSVTEGGLILW